MPSHRRLGCAGFLRRVASCWHLPSVHVGGLRWRRREDGCWPWGLNRVCVGFAQTAVGVQGMLERTIMLLSAGV